ncbi:uncharacterized protein FIBRA_05804 [Fibroporia radiculosa]|uniref:Enoyl-CoA hydratase n=1 Tax=Fibroporia radiculosa TaxID=599839 RepID=J4GRM9_9APHY|nr:uncharacterized protein FIBRA_05804 [Fibroporia radiculosa]CCM03660.1 predicted protein [Fibroporia radiculosa]
MEGDISKVLHWFDNEPSLWFVLTSSVHGDSHLSYTRVVVITGEGRMFCAGADLIAWNKRSEAGLLGDEGESIISDTDGFGSISRRYSSSKPMIAAVNGGAYGGGMELIMNCDLVIAGENAKFAFPEVKRGVVAIQGGMRSYLLWNIDHLIGTTSNLLASELLLLGRTITATEAAIRFGFINQVVPDDQVLQTALHWAADINANSPDAVQSTKRALLLANRIASVEDVVVAHARSKETIRQQTSTNIKEGLKAFTEKRRPVWTNPAKL